MKWVAIFVSSGSFPNRLTGAAELKRFESASCQSRVKAWSSSAVPLRFRCCPGAVPVRSRCGSTLRSSLALGPP